MDTKISCEFWSDPDIEATTAEVKLAALWLLTNLRINLCGYAEVTPERFAFETALPKEALARAYEALPKSFVRVGKGYWAKNFVRRQIGHGPALVRNNMSGPIVEALRSGPGELVEIMLTVYPELSELYGKVTKKALAEGLPSPSQGERVGVGVGARERAGVEQGGAGGTVPPKTRAKSAKAGSTRPADHPEPMRSRLVAVAAVMNRRPDSVWNDAEKKAFGAAGLDTLDEVDFTEQVESMRRFYRAKISPAKERTFWKRSTLPILLNNWPSELDKARAWLRDASPEGDGVTVV